VGIRTSDPLSMLRRMISYPPQIHASILHFLDIIYATFILRRMFGTTTSSTEFFCHASLGCDTIQKVQNMNKIDGWYRK
jgi:hypothetical protein